MRMTMKDRKIMTKGLAGQYRRARKKEKGVILDQLVEATGYNRHHAAWLLRHHGQRMVLRPRLVVEGDVHQRPRWPRPRVYDEPVLASLQQLWELLDYPSGKHLAAALPSVVPHLIAHQALRVSEVVRDKLLRISPATIDRLLKPVRAKYVLKGRSLTKPGTLLKHQIPIRTFRDWDQTQPGFMEIDLVGHDGGNPRGEFCFTLDMTDVATGWTELAAVPNKARIWVIQALQELRPRLPFPLLGLDSDNGGEFINHHLQAYCQQEQLNLTRSRPYYSNDTCYVEQKNWSRVRRFVGYARYDTRAACALLNQLHRLLRDYTNFFLPSMKLMEKTREGALVKRRHDTPQTPYQRVLACDKLDPAHKRALTDYFNHLNLKQLHDQIRRLQARLAKHHARALHPEQAA
jgi:hypothetical protein